MSSLLDIATRFRADKVQDHPGYCAVYEESLATVRMRELSLLEIGIWQGNSLKTWLDWMPHATITGIDLLIPELLLSGDKSCRLAMHACSQDDAEKLSTLFRPNTLDVIIDDGSHRLEHQLLSLHYLWAALRRGGLYFIEDIQRFEYLEYFEMLPGYRCYDLRKESDRYDDILISFRKPE